MARAPTMKDMQSRLDLIDREIEKLQAQKELILDMMGTTPEPEQARARKGSVKKVVLELLEEAGERGLNAHMTINRAKEKGFDLERGSVSSLLSRLKSDGIVVYNGEQYILKHRGKSAPTAPTVTPLRTSGGSTFG